MTTPPENPLPENSLSTLLVSFNSCLKELVDGEDEKSDVYTAAILANYLFTLVSNPGRDKQTVKDLFEALIIELLENYQKKGNARPLMELEIYETLRQLRELYTKLNSNIPSHENSRPNF